MKGEFEESQRMAIKSSIPTLSKLSPFKWRSKLASIRHSYLAGGWERRATLEHLRSPICPSINHLRAKLSLRIFYFAF